MSGVPERLMSRHVTWLRHGTRTDRYGNTLPDWAAPTATQITAWIEPLAGLPRLQAGLGTLDGRDINVAEQLLVTNTAGLDAADRIVSDDTVTYEIVGKPAVIHTPKGVHHYEAIMQKVAD